MPNQPRPRRLPLKGTAPDPNRQRLARQRLRDLFGQPSSVYAVHYACESITGAGSARIASIVARNLGDGATYAFSIHQEAELALTPPEHYARELDRLEFALLQKFFRFLSENQRARFVHWKMRDASYGFEAIELRYRRLGGAKPLPIHDSQKLNLAAHLKDIYGEGYAEPANIVGLARLNAFTMEGLIAGPDEPIAFQRHEYHALLRSTTRKVALIGDIARASADGRLKTTKGWWQMNGGRLREAAEGARDNPMKSVGALIMGAAGGAFLLAGKVMDWFGQ
jgi:hypothetical protein